MRRALAKSAWLGGDNLVRNVVLEYDRGSITSITPNAPDNAASLLDGIVIPGLVNVHSHSFHRALRGHTQQQGGDFWSWRDLMYKVASELYPDTLRRLAAGVFAEMVVGGITSVGEFHYLHHAAGGDRYPDGNAMGVALIQAAADAGIRLTIIDTCYLASNVAGAPPSRQQQRFSDGSVEAWSERVRALAGIVADAPNVELAVAAHSVRAVPVKDLPVIRSTADELQAPVHVHLSEQPAENEACLAEHGVTPTELLVDTGVLGPGSTAIHATHLTDRDIELLGASGAAVCLCPTTERDLADGLGPAAELTAAGVELSLGTDSNAVVDLFEEARAIEMHDRLRLGRRGIHSAESLLAAATASGASSIGWPGTGRLEVGAAADFVVLGTDSYALAGLALDGPTAPLLYAATRADVTDVFVGGRQVAAGGRHADAWDPAALAGGLAAVLE